MLLLTSVSFESDHLFFYVFCSLPGHESPSGSRCVISEFIRPLQISGDKPEQLSVKPTFLSKSRSDTPRCRFDSDVSLLKFLAGNTWCGARICLLRRLIQDHPPTCKKKRHEIHIFGTNCACDQQEFHWNFQSLGIPWMYLRLIHK